MTATLPRHDQPIVAIATAPGRAGIGIVRVSGANLTPLIEAVCGRPLTARRATYGAFLDADGAAIDHGLALHFPAPQSATGEDVLELHGHGGPVVLQLLLARLLEAGTDIGLRVSRPGEFSERAYLNGKLDLAQAEAVADLIDASTEAAARSAVRSLAGAFSREVHALRDALIAVRLLIEATLDFPDEEIDILRDADVVARLEALVVQTGTVLARTRQGALLQRGLVVVIAGQPNVGKSSLLNALAGAELAIVSPIAGTTRDKVAAALQIGGLPVQVIDTAGLRETEDPVERIGVERAWAAVGDADVVLLLHDGTHAHDVAHVAADAALASHLPASLVDAGRVLHVTTKSDLVEPALRDAPADADADAVTVSARTFAGLDTLRERLLALAGAEPATEDSYTARTRHVVALQSVRGHLVSAVAHLAVAPAALDLCAEELRLGQDALGAITGEFTADDLLGEIFGRFCIGK